MGWRCRAALLLLAIQQAHSAAGRFGGGGHGRWLGKPAQQSAALAPPLDAALAVRGGAAGVGTADMDAKPEKPPLANVLLVQIMDSGGDDVVVEVPADTMETLGMFKGDTIRLTGRQRKRTIAIVSPSKAGGAKKGAIPVARISATAARNLRVREGGVIALHQIAGGVRDGREVTLTPVAFEEDEEDESEDKDEEDEDEEDEDEEDKPNPLDPTMLFDECVVIALSVV